MRMKMKKMKDFFRIFDLLKLYLVNVLVVTNYI